MTVHSEILEEHASTVARLRADAPVGPPPFVDHAVAAALLQIVEVLQQISDELRQTRERL